MLINDLDSYNKYTLQNDKIAESLRVTHCH